MIDASWGGSRIEEWTPPVGFKLVPELENITQIVESWDPTTEVGQKSWTEFFSQLKKWLPRAEKALAERKPLPMIPKQPGPELSNQEPTKLYNGMIHPFIPYAIRGVIWYQGENNGWEEDSYFHKMKAVILGWRQLWGLGDFPFYYVQLANHREPNKDPAGEDSAGWSRVREAQRKSLSIANTGMAVTIDIGEAIYLHPKNKQDVGKRLALWALAKDYKKNLVYSGPLYKNHKAEGNKIIIHFDHVGSGLMVGEKKGLAPVAEIKGWTLKQFAISGDDKKWFWADARIIGDKVVVSSDKVKKPVHVRYAYSMNPEGCNLYNKEGLPASPFRTDRW